MSEYDNIFNCHRCGLLIIDQNKKDQNGICLKCLKIMEEQIVELGRQIGLKERIKNQRRKKVK